MSDNNVSTKKITSRELKEWIVGLLILAIMGCVGNRIAYKVPILDSLPGMAMIYVIGILGMIVTKFIPGDMPAMVYVSIIGMLVALPFMPTAAVVNEYVGKINLMAVVTPILGYAGITVGRDWGAFRKLGWRAIVVGIVVLFSAYFWGAVIAEVLLRVQGTI